MNKNLHRIIFNAKRGQRMVVAETASAQGKAVGGETSGASAAPATLANLHPLRFAVLSALGLVLWLQPAAFTPVHAQIIAAPGAPAGQRPTVLQTANGLAQVNIQTPSAAGVSRNTYSQFDVPQSGAILNNSRTNVQTQLGGFVGGNPWLATGPARVILNEVQSANPSQIRGYVEVAGQRAEVIIANPAGINVNGGGFLNASRVTLTTGSPVMNGGALESFRVQGGSVTVGGAGLDTSTADYTAILARAVQVNAGIWAKELRVVTGANDISADHASTTPITGGAGSGAAPAYAIDVAQLGGMYAGKIYLIGTETGLGVRNAGVIAATGGELVLQANGWLTNSGALQAAGNVQVNTLGAITNSGAGAVISAQGSGTITTGAGLANEAGAMMVATGTLAVTAAGAIQNTQATIAGNGSVTLNAASLSNASGTVASVGGDLAVTTTGITSNTVAGGAAQSGRLSAGGNVTLSNTGLINTGSTVAGAAITIDTHQQAFNNTGGTVSASGITSLTTVNSGALTNTAGLIQSTGALAINTHGQTLVNTNAAGYSSGAGGITSQGAMTLTTGDINNAAGAIGANGVMTVSAGNVSNAGGQIISESTAGFTTTGFNNSGGQLQAAGNVSVAAGPGAITNTGGLIRSGATVTLAAASVVNSNTSGANQGLEGQNIAITAASVANDAGAIRTGVDATVTSSGSINNNAGLISAGNTATLQDSAAARTLAITNAGGTVIAGLSLVANAASLGGSGSLLSQQDLSLTLTSDFNNTGEVIANRDVTVSTTGNLSNSGKLQAGRNLAASSANVNNATTGIISGVNTTVTAVSTLTNRGVIDGTETRLNAATLTNIGTGRIYGDHVAIAATTVNNSTETVNGTRADAVIAARQRLDIGAQTLNNGEGALIFSGGTTADALNIGASLDAGGHATGQAGTVNNSGGTIESLGGLSITAGQINNTNPNFAYTVQSTPGAQTREYITGQGLYTTADIAWELGTLAPAGHGGYLYADGRQGRFLLKGAAYSQAVYAPYYGGSDAYVAEHTVRVGTGDSAEDVYVPPAFSYASGDQVWAAFSMASPGTGMPGPKPTGRYVSSGDGERYIPPDPVEMAAWEAAAAPWLELQSRINSFRATVNATAITFDGFREYSATSHSTTITQSSPGRILSAGAMTLHAATSLVNDQSQIIAGGALNITGQAVDNRGRSISVNAQRTGTAYAWSNYNEGCGGWDGCDYNYNAYRDSAYVQDVPQTITLNAFQTRSFTVPGGTGTQVAAVAGASIGSNPSAPGALSAAGVRTVPVNLSIPTTSLFRLNPNPAGGFLIETDPRFANYRMWLGSDYMLSQLTLDPTVTQKRLGDGFYEQRLINEQVAQLTGQRFLGNYSNEEAQYKALMDAGITYAQTYNLRPGIALSAVQMAQLTSDIVWLVEQEVTLADGSKTRALVPQVYVHVKDTDLAPTGALLAGQSVNINLAGDMTNTGTVAGRTVVNLTAENVQNLGGRITGDAVTVAARNDLNNIGGQIIAATSLNASAGRDLNVVTTTSSASNQTGGLGSGGNATAVNASSNNTFSMTGIDRVAGLYVSNPGGTLVASAGRDANIIAGVISNSGANGNTVISAGNNINLGTVATANSSDQRRGDDDFVRDAQTKEVGSQIQAAGSLTLIAGNDLNAKAASVQATGDLTASAGNDVNISEGLQTNSFGFGLTTAESDLFSSSSTKEGRTTDQDNVVGSSFGGNTVTVVAGKDINVKGSAVISDTGTTLAAGRNISIEAAQNTSSSTSFFEKKESGLLDGEGFGVTVGTREQSTDQKNRGATAAASTVGSIGGNVTLVANEAYKQVGSDVMAPGGDVTIVAKKVDIVEARETSRSETEQKFKQTGLTLEVQSPVISAMQTIDKMSEAASDTKDSRMQGLALANAGFAGKNAYDAIKAGQGTVMNGQEGQMATGAKNPDGTAASRDANAAEKVGGINVAISIGSSESQSNSTSQSNTGRGSAVTAGGTIAIAATGAGADSNLTIQGSNVEAGRAVQLLADNQVKLLAAQNTASEKSTNSNSSGSIGISFGTDGLLLNLSASAGKGRGDGADTFYTNTQVKAGDQVSITSGGDTTLQGAVVKANQVKADVGGNLNITSLQDTSTYTSEQKSMGGSLSVGFGKMSGSVSASKSNIDSNFNSVGEQSGIKAGSGGFQVSVAGNTALLGSVIASDTQAVNAQKNSFKTGGTLTIADIQNVASYSAKSFSISVGSNQQPTGKMDLSGLGLGIGSDKGDASSTSSAGISGIAGNTAVRSADAEAGLQKIFDADKVQREINAQMQITQAFTREAPKAVASYAASKFNELKDTDPAEAAKWAEGGIYRIALHTAVGALGGGLDGAAGAAASASSANLMNALQDGIQQSLVAAGLSDGAAKALAQSVATLTAAGIGAAVGGAQGAATAATVDANNRQLHLVSKAQVRALAKEEAAKLGTTEEKLYQASLMVLGDYFDDNGDIRPEFNNVTADEYMQAQRMLLAQPANSLMAREMAEALRVVLPQFASPDEGTVNVGRVIAGLTRAVDLVKVGAGKFAVDRPKLGSVSDANFAQTSIRSDEKFSVDGREKYSLLGAGPINTVDDLASALSKGLIRPSQVPVDYVTTSGGTKLILNTRTSVALDRAGISQSQWYGSNKTGMQVPGEQAGVTFDKLAAQQLANNQLPSTGTPNMPGSKK